MWLKMLGSLMVLFSGTALGWINANRYNLRVKNLRELQLAINLFNTEIIYQQTILADALKKTAVGTEAPVSNLFTDASKILAAKREKIFSDIWDQVIKKYRYELDLKKDTLKVLQEWAQQIGSSDLTAQRKINEMTLNKLTACEEKAVKAAEKKVKLYRYSGVLMSLLLIILFY